MRASILVIIVLLSTAATTEAAQKCTGTPRKLNGKMCASTTIYHDGNKGACGCGMQNTPFSWNQNGYVAAASDKLFNSPKRWCGFSCGKCVKLTTTGGFVPNEGKAPPSTGKSIVVMITNMCPGPENSKWCNQLKYPGGSNAFGYEAHFDLENSASQIRKLGWDNPEVTYEFTNCDLAHRHDSRTPSQNMYHQCECA